MTNEHLVTLTTALALTCAIAIRIPTKSSAHCDTMDGPVIAAAKHAMETRNQKLSPETKELADIYFFETLVRTH